MKVLAIFFCGLVSAQSWAAPSQVSCSEFLPGNSKRVVTLQRSDVLGAPSWWIERYFFLST